MNIPSLPAIRPHEILNSVIMRMLLEQGDDISLYAYHKYRQQPPLPYSHVMVPPTTELLKRIPGAWGITSDSLISSCCVLPLFSPFLAANDRKRHFASVTKPGELDSPMLFKRVRLSTPCDYFRVCPACCKNDQDAWGNPYLRRQHHLPSINFCLDHGQRLINVGDKYTFIPEINRRMMEAMSGQESPVDYITEDLRVHLRDAADLLFKRPINLNEEISFVRIYRYRLDRLCIKRWGLDEHLIGAMYCKYGKVAAENLDFNKWTPSIKGYLAGSQAYLPPIAHLMIQHFLGLSFSTAIEYGNGKLWKCANPFTNCGFATTERCSVKGSSTEHITCPACGFGGRISGDTPLGAKPKVRRLHNRGPIFDAHMSALLAQNLPAREIRKLSGLTKYAYAKILRDMGAPCESIQKKVLVPSSLSVRIARRDQHRQTFKSFVKLHPECRRTAVAKSLPTEYAWLTKHDRDWYEVHAPIQSPKSTEWLAPFQPPQAAALLAEKRRKGGK